MNTLYDYLQNLLTEVAELDTQLILLAMLIVVAVIIIDATGMTSRQLRRKSGMLPDIKAIGIDGFDTLPVKQYVSDLQGLAGRPDAVIVENGEFIPVERKPLSKKIRDRHVAQLLVYMRLIEEFEGKKPPYGYLILGPQCRRVKIINSDEKQEWLSKQLKEMRDILVGRNGAKAAPHPAKCKKCSFNDVCTHKV